MAWKLVSPREFHARMERAARDMHREGKITKKEMWDCLHHLEQQRSQKCDDRLTMSVFVRESS